MSEFLTWTNIAINFGPKTPNVQLFYTKLEELNKFFIALRSSYPKQSGWQKKTDAQILKKIKLGPNFQQIYMYAGKFFKTRFLVCLFFAIMKMCFGWLSCESFSRWVMRLNYSMLIVWNQLKMYVQQVERTLTLKLYTDWFIDFIMGKNF